MPFKVSFPLETRLSRMHEPGAWIARVSPRPLLMIIAQADHITLTDLKLRAYEDALEPKKLVTIEGGHFDVYLGQFATASGAAVSWFREHLNRGGGGDASNAARDQVEGR